MSVTVRAVRGDITEQEVDAIVNAANEWMLGGGGVDGAIHRAAGPELLECCLEVAEVRPGVRCPTGEARITEGCALSAAFVIHTVGPRYTMSDAAGLLEEAFRSSLALASTHEAIRSVAVPAISCGVFGYPIEEAAAIAVRVAREGWDLDEIRFVLCDESDLRVFEAALENRVGQKP